MGKSAKGKASAGDQPTSPSMEAQGRIHRRVIDNGERRIETGSSPNAPPPLAARFRDMLRADAGSPLPRSEAPDVPKPTLCVRLQGAIPEIEHDPRLKKLPWIDRMSLFHMAGFALGMTPSEHLYSLRILTTTFGDEDASMRPHWARIARILQAIHSEVADPQSPFLKVADTAARAVLKLSKGDDLLTDRDVALEHMRDEVIRMLEQESSTDDIALWLGIFLDQTWAVEIAKDIPHAQTVLYSKRYLRACAAMHRIRYSKRAQEDLATAAECMIRKWLKEIGYPAAMAKAAFDAERAREERKIGKRR